MALNIVFMGTPDFAAGALKSIIESRHNVVAVVTQPDRQKGRGRGVVASPVKEAAMEAGIPVFQPDRINKPEHTAALREYEADIYVVAAFGQILSQEILDIPKYGCVNIHASLLPKHRGAAPIQQAILDGDEVTGITIMQMDAGLDTGDMISKAQVSIEDDDTAESLHDKLMEAGAELIKITLDTIEDGTAVRTPQDDSQSTYASRMDKSLGDIDWSMDSVSIGRRIRAYYPWPGTRACHNGKILKILSAVTVNSDTEVSAASNVGPGTITEVNKRGIRVRTGAGDLVITRVQPEGKKPMEVKDFLNGYNIVAGERFTEV